MKTPMRPNSLSRQRGTAMTETVLVLPFLVLILALLLFFGRAMVRVQRTAVTDRYEAWRQVANSPGPQADNSAGNPHLDQAFFNNAAQHIDVNAYDGFPRAAADELLRRTSALSIDAGELARDIFDDLPGGRTVAVAAEHRNGVRAWERFNRPIRHRHTRFGNDWRFVTGWVVDQDDPDLAQSQRWRPAQPYVRHNRTVQNRYFVSFDQAISPLAQSNTLAAQVRDLYVREPGYVGPEIRTD